MRRFLKKTIRLLSSRLLWFALLMASQFIILILAAFYFSNDVHVLFLLLAMSFCAVLFVATREESPDYKLSWMLIICVFPLAGGILYLIFGKKKIGKIASRKILQTRDLGHYDIEDITREELEGIDESEARQMSYIYQTSGYAPAKNTSVRYFAFGDDFFNDLINEIEKAEKFIFIEYFILAPGKVWDTILEILRRKSREGVLIRILYDDLGSINVLPAGYAQKLRAMGFEAYTFNPLALHMNPRLNYRDHRKIFNIDGNVCYSGGLNLADEYTNDIIRFAYWKDNAMKISGQAVWNFTMMFLLVWKAITKKEEDFSLFRPSVSVPSDGYVQPFADSPFDERAIARNVYLQAINNARQYVWMVSPYLILDSEITTALSIAAASGVDVRIVTPHYADKKSVHEVTRSVYKRLVSQGVRIYEFTPGFIHSKTLVADDKIALVGTANLDYRSFYLHFELSVLFAGGTVIKSVKDDTIYALERSDEQTMEKVVKVSFFRRLVRTFFGFFATAL